MSVLNFGFHAIDFGFFVSEKRIPNFNRQRDCRFPGLKCWPPKPWIRNSTSKKFPRGRFGLLYMQREVQNNNDLLYVESFCPIKEAGYVVRLYIIPKTFLAGRNSILSLLDTEAKTKGKPTKLVCYYKVLFTFVTFRLITRDLDQLEDLERNPRYIGILKGAPNDCFL